MTESAATDYEEMGNRSLPPTETVATTTVRGTVGAGIYPAIMLPPPSLPTDEPTYWEHVLFGALLIVMILSIWMCFWETGKRLFSEVWSAANENKRTLITFENIRFVNRFNLIDPRDEVEVNDPFFFVIICFPKKRRRRMKT